SRNNRVHRFEAFGGGSARPRAAPSVRTVFVLDQDTFGGPADILILAAPERPDEGAQGEGAEGQGDRGEDEDDVHRPLPTRRALRLTASDEPDMARAATNGLTRPAMAAGAAMRL